MFLWSPRKDISEQSSEYPEKEITSDRKQKEAFCETALHHLNSTHKVKFLFSLSRLIILFRGIYKRIFASALKSMVTKEIFSDEN